MLFSSSIFIFIFLPAVVFIYYIFLRKSRILQNVFLFFSSLFFYAWGEPKFVLVMMASIVINWAFGLLVDSFKKLSRITTAKLCIFLDITFNLAIIFVFKYLMFTVENMNNLLGTSIAVPNIVLPIGISFFTFQAISYVIDVYREKGEAQKNIINVGLYIALFPQLIAGPIVRYETVAEQIKNRVENFTDFSSGVVRFIIGLAKKVILSNNMAIVADCAFELANEGGGLSVAMAWLGAIAYTLQIFFDFAGYSDMAIGLGKMFGFHFLENFNYPYISKSATEFWRRWHMSLGSWFRDYLYIPLGGSRVDSRARHIFNLFVVWLCTGIWHGANWTFIIWGLMYFVLLVFEKYSKFNKLANSAGINFVKHCYTIFFVIMGWVVFRAENITVVVEYYQAMFCLDGAAIIDNVFIQHLRQYIVYFIAGIVFSLPIAGKIRYKAKDLPLTNVIYAVMILMVFLVSVSFIIKGSYNPFIYFNF